jgi:hypothetical protein
LVKFVGDDVGDNVVIDVGVVNVDGGVLVGDNVDVVVASVAVNDGCDDG